MIERALRQIAYGNHLRTLRCLGFDLAGMAVLDAGGHLVWSYPEAAGPGCAMREALDAFRRPDPGTTPTAPQAFALPDGREVFCAFVDDDARQRLLKIVVVAAPDTAPGEGLVARLAPALQAVAANILNEFNLVRELESMAGELGERYEELNLLFHSDATPAEGMFGYESLRRLVRDTADFLGVGLAALLMPAREMRIHHADPAFDAADVTALFEDLCMRQFDRLRQTPGPIVINTARDRMRERLARDFAGKLLIVPVQGEGAEVDGMLLIVNRPDEDDFSNSDRNLLEVMANRVTKVLQVNFDGLTGLENRQSFEWAVGQALQQSRSRGFTHAVLHVDVDRTGVINDVGGRSAGDELIRVVSRALAGRVRVQDSVARIAGDEFGVLLEICPLDSAAALAREVGRQIEATEFEWQGSLHPVSVCIGVAPINAESETVAAVLGSAEVACAAAKEKGRNRIQVYEHNDLDLLRRRGEFRWVSRIQSALHDDRFVLHAQRIQPLRAESGAPHYEVLVRMLDEHGELVAPGGFMPAAEHFHLMPAIDRWVVQRVIAELSTAAKRSGAAPLRLSVNLSGQSLSDDQVRSRACELLQGLGPLAQNLCFEITESAAIANMEQALEFIAALKAVGCRCSLDDFGSGLSSFAYLQRFDVDFLKIDGSFVRRVGEDPVADAMVSAINQVGQVMGLSTIAEFVENGVIDQRLRALGVDYGQGYHYHRPEPLGDVLRGLALARRVAQG